MSNSHDSYLAYGISSTTYFEKNIEVIMKMDLCICVAWVEACRPFAISKSLVMSLLLLHRLVLLCSELNALMNQGR